jgi:CRP-like cAMP-binding protein
MSGHGGALAGHAKIVRYRTDEVLQHSGEDGPTGDGGLIHVATLEEGAFIGQTSLTRQPVLNTAYAIEEVTVLEMELQVMEELVLHRPYFGSACGIGPGGVQR